MARTPEERRAFAARAAARAAKDPPRAAMGYDPTDRGERCRSTRWFKVEAERYVAAAKAGDRDAKRQLEMIRMACSLFMQAMKDGMLDATLKPEPRVTKVKLKPPSARYLARRAAERRAAAVRRQAVLHRRIAARRLAGVRARLGGAA